jgi:type I restriction enzyme M protein
MACYSEVPPLPILTKQQLGQLLWSIADTGLRGKVEDYKAYVLSLLFFKRLSDNYSWESRQRALEFERDFGITPSDKQLLRLEKEGHDFIVPEGCFWADVRNAPIDKKNEKLDAALTNIAEANPALRGIINSVRWNEPAPDGSGNKRIDPEVLVAAMNALNPIELDNSKTSADVLGDAYEYLIKRFADENKGGTTAGQFYTPPEVREIIVRALCPEPGHTLYDPTAGSGGFLIDGAKYAKEHGGGLPVGLFGQETIWNTWAIANINMHVHGLAAIAQLKQGNTLKEPKFLRDEGAGVRQFDRVTSNFPFSEENWWLNGRPKVDAKGRAVLKKNGAPQMEYPDKSDFGDPYNRLAYGVPNFSNGDFVFLQHIVASLNETGRAGVVCPQGVLFRGQPAKTEADDGQNRKPDDEYLIRRGFVEGRVDKNCSPIGERDCLLEAIVVLPDNLFYGTSIPGCILFFNRAKPAARADKVLMVYAARSGWYRESPDQNVLQPHDVLRIIVQLLAWGDSTVARAILPEQKARLYAAIEDRRQFDRLEIESRFHDEITESSTINDTLAVGHSLALADRRRLEARLTRLKGVTDRVRRALDDVNGRANLERDAVDAVESELLEMLDDPEKRRRYFAIVDVDEIRENEFNLNISRYVDTLDPEEELDLTACAKRLSDALVIEKREQLRVEGILAAVVRQ